MYNRVQTVQKIKIFNRNVNLQLKYNCADEVEN